MYYMKSTVIYNGYNVLGVTGTNNTKIWIQKAHVP